MTRCCMSCPRATRRLPLTDLLPGDTANVDTAPRMVRNLLDELEVLCAMRVPLPAAIPGGALWESRCDFSKSLPVWGCVLYRRSCKCSCTTRASHRNSWEYGEGREQCLHVLPRASHNDPSLSAPFDVQSVSFAL